MQAIQALPWWAKAAFLFVLIVAGVAGFDVLGSNTSLLQISEQMSEEKEFQNVEVTVQDRNTSQPVENVEIQIIFDGPPVRKMTDRNGYVAIDIPVRDTVQLVLSHGSYKTARETINLNTDPETNRILYLDSINP